MDEVGSNKEQFLSRALKAPSGMVTRFQPRYNYIRDEHNFDETAFIEDVKGLPMSAV